MRATGDKYTGAAGVGVEAVPGHGATARLVVPVVSRAESAGRMGIVLPALLTRFCGGTGVGSGAWVRPDLRIG
jgi:hypothetical protein